MKLQLKKEKGWYHTKMISISQTQKNTTAFMTIQYRMHYLTPVKYPRSQNIKLK